MLKSSYLLPVYLYTLGHFFLFGKISNAQVIPDNTVNTQVNRNGNITEITGGNTQGSNLFHSFQDFSIPINNEAFFNNAGNIDNIFSRVTGGNISNINGLIRSNGNANLFLINPAGIVFGNNARLDIGGSFLGSTSNSILFPNNVEFSASDPQNPILTINAPIGLGFRDEVNAIAVNAAELEVNTGNSLSLLAGDIIIDRGSLRAIGGTIDLGGLVAAGEIGINGNGFSFPEGIDRANISLDNRAIVNVRGNNAGAININANNLEFSNESQFLAGIDSDAGFDGARAGNITINTNNLLARANSQIRNEVLGIGNAGDINITTNSLNFSERSVIVGTTFATGDAADITINATGNVAFDNLTNDSVSDGNFAGIHSSIGLQANDTIAEGTMATGNGGDIEINAGSFSLTNGARLVTNSAGEGNAGNIQINAVDTIFVNGTPTNIFKTTAILAQATSNGMGDAGNITINGKSFEFDNASLLGADSFTVGNAGNITINTSKRVFLGTDTLLITQIQENAIGNGGNIAIDTQDLHLLDSFVLSDSKGTGDAGNIEINASNSVLIEDAPDTDLTVFPEGSLIISGVGILGDNIEGNAGNIEINTKNLTANGSSFIIAQTNGIGDGGDIIVNSQEGIFLNGSSRILSQVLEDAVGNGGEINLTSSTISLDGLSAISTTTLVGGEGIAGNINLDANNITLADAAIIDALTENDFDGGDITITANSLNLINGGKIVTATDAFGNAGNISLDIRENINIAGNNPEFTQFITELTEDEINRENGEMSDDRFRSATPSTILTVLGASSGLFANTSKNSLGNGGNIKITNPDRFNLADTALISVSSEGVGSAGSLVVETRSLSLNNSSLIAETPAGIGGNINLIVTDNLELKNNSLISSQATGDASGGNIDIDAEFVIAFPSQNNDIIANADRGQGGNINISARSIIGLQEATSVTDNFTNDIDASSQFGFDGNINLNTPDLNPLQGVSELPTNIVVSLKTTTQSCNPNRTEASGLTITGKGGIIYPPEIPLTSSNVIIDGKTNNYIDNIPQPINTSKGKIQPARGITIDSQGKIILTAYKTNNSGDRITSDRLNCQ